VREQRQRIRPIKNLAGGPYRVHHYVPGIALALASGVAAIATDSDDLRPWLAAPLGVGTAMTLDDAAILFECEDVYWDTEWLPLAEAGGAVAATLLSVLASCIAEVEGADREQTRSTERRRLGTTVSRSAPKCWRRR
jgi:hypothetical protein